MEKSGPRSPEAITGGACEQVSEIEIAQAKAEIGAEGIGCEPASAVTLAGLKKLVKQGFVKREESVVLVLTGNSAGRIPTTPWKFSSRRFIQRRLSAKLRAQRIEPAAPSYADRSGRHAGRGDTNTLEQAEK